MIKPAWLIGPVIRVESLGRGAEYFVNSIGSVTRFYVSVGWVSCTVNGTSYNPTLCTLGGATLDGVAGIQIYDRIYYCGTSSDRKTSYLCKFDTITKTHSTIWSAYGATWGLTDGSLGAAVNGKYIVANINNGTGGTFYQYLIVLNTDDDSYSLLINGTSFGAAQTGTYYPDLTNGNIYGPRVASGDYVSSPIGSWSPTSLYAGTGCYYWGNGYFTRGTTDNVIRASGSRTWTISGYTHVGKGAVYLGSSGGYDYFFAVMYNTAAAQPQACIVKCLDTGTTYTVTVLAQNGTGGLSFSALPVAGGGYARTDDSRGLGSGIPMWICPAGGTTWFRFFQKELA